jgi:hypothetical protein
MSVQMIELEDAQMIEVRDDVLEAVAADVAAQYSLSSEAHAINKFKHC